MCEVETYWIHDGDLMMMMKGYDCRLDNNNVLNAVNSLKVKNPGET